MFGKPLTAAEINAKYSPYEELMARYGKLDSLNYEEVCQFESDFGDYANYFSRANGSHRMYLPNGMWPADFKRIAERKKTLIMERDPKARLFYENKIVINDETVNGYELYNIDHDLMSFEYLKEMWELWNQPDISEEEFKEWLDEHLCSDWAKMDRHGECFGGFWTYPVDSEEYKNAWHLSRDDNIQGLLELPYPRSILIKTIEIGCSNRHESVRYSNFWCEWIKRKAEVVFANNIPSLQDIARLVAKTQGEIPAHLQ